LEDFFNLKPATKVQEAQKNGIENGNAIGCFFKEYVGTINEGN